MFAILGFEEIRPVTPIWDPQGGRIVQLVPGLTRSYLKLKLLGREIRVRVPAMVLDFLWPSPPQGQALRQALEQAQQDL